MARKENFDSNNSAPRERRLGTVMRFRPGAAPSGIRSMAADGLRVASSSDFRTSAAVPNDLEGADVQYFERFGIAIVRSNGDRIAPMVQRARQDRMLSGLRPERLYRALGSAARIGRRPRMQDADPGPLDILDPRYLNGYRDAVNVLVDRLLLKGAAAPAPARRRPRMQATDVTWGLEATKVSRSRYSGAGIKLAVLDTGFDDTHPDFAGRIITKKSFVTNSSDDDLVGHGTHCIGTACGSLHPSGVPRYGVAWEAEIYAGKVLGDDGFGSDRSIIAGMEWALDQGCVIISMSLGAPVNVGDSPSEDYEQIGEVCLDAGCLVIAAAGNESNRPHSIRPVGSPANASTIMAVAAIDEDFEVAEFSCGQRNEGQDVDIAGPGVDVFSSIPGGDHDSFQGTSMATPHVAGIAALYAESDPRLRGRELWAQLIETAAALAHPARDVGAGLVQAP